MSTALYRIEPQELVQIVESVFSSMLGMEIAACDTPWFESGERLTASVLLAGDWHGALLVECSEEQACLFAGGYLSIKPPAAVDDVVRDFLGELANMIGGNLKSVLGNGIQLSMPAVVNGTNYFMRVCGVEVRERMAFCSPKGTFWVTFLTTNS